MSRKLPTSHEKEELLTNLNGKNSKQSRVHKAWEELIQGNALQMTLEVSSSIHTCGPELMVVMDKWNSTTRFMRRTYCWFLEVPSKEEGLVEEDFTSRRGRMNRDIWHTSLVTNPQPKTWRCKFFEDVGLFKPHFTNPECPRHRVCPLRSLWFSKICSYLHTCTMRSTKNMYHRNMFAACESFVSYGPWEESNAQSTTIAVLQSETGQCLSYVHGGVQSGSVKPIKEPSGSVGKM